MKGTASASGLIGVHGRQIEWYDTGSLAYGAQGRRDVLIVECDQPLSQSDPEVVPRRPGHLTDNDIKKLKSQEVASDELDEATIIKKRYEKDKRRDLFKVLKSETEHQLSRETVMGSITQLFETTKNDGGMYVL